MRYRRMPIEVESPEELGYDTIANNLAESSFSDLRLADYGIDADVSADLLLQYGDHRGLPELRELIARDGRRRRTTCSSSPGAAPALFLVATALLEPGDHALVVRPNYATNVETPRAIGADVEYVDLRFEDALGAGPRADRRCAAARARRLVSVCVPHNPTGRTMIEPASSRAIVDVVERHPGARLLVDETYRELAYDAPPLPLAASALRPRDRRLLALQGLRPARACASAGSRRRDPELPETLLLAAKEQVLLAGSTARRDDGRPRARAPRRGAPRHARQRRASARDAS